MFRKTLLAIGVVIAAVHAIALGRLYVGIPFVPPSGREIVTRLSGLPIPVLAHSEDAVDQCAGMLCMDYYGRGLIRLSPSACSKAIAAAKTRGWRSLPLPEDLVVAQEDGVPPTPHQGYFRFEQRQPNEHKFAWIDTTTCQVYAELDIT
jgi:hypothetical protein